MIEVVNKPTDHLIPYVNNARTHDESQITQIASSIQEFGFTNPVLIDKENTIIAGHGRLEAAKKLGMKEVPTICLDYLTEAQKKAYILADNRLAENAGWDMDLVSVDLNELLDMDFDIDLTGFDKTDILTADFEPVDIDQQGKLDQLDPLYVICPSCGKEFDAKA